jgi:hypothetical protein
MFSRIALVLSLVLPPAIAGAQGAPFTVPARAPGAVRVATFNASLNRDQNADPADGDTVDQLLKHPKINATFPPISPGAVEARRHQGGANERHRGDPATDMADFNDRVVRNPRVDYVLPSKDLTVQGGGVYWPTSGDPLARLTKMNLPATSDHRLAWLDLEPKAGPRT